MKDHNVMLVTRFTWPRKEMNVFDAVMYETHDRLTSGEVETLRAELDKTREVLARLFRYLVGAGVISKQGIAGMLDEFEVRNAAE